MCYLVSSTVVKVGCRQQGDATGKLKFSVLLLLRLFSADHADAGAVADPVVHSNRLRIRGDRTRGSVRTLVPDGLPNPPEGHALDLRDERVTYVRDLQLDVALLRL